MRPSFVCREQKKEIEFATVSNSAAALLSRGDEPDTLCVFPEDPSEDF